MNGVKKYFKDKSYDSIIYAPSNSNMHKPFYDAVKEVAKDEQLFAFEKTKSAGASKKFCDYYQHFDIILPFDKIDTPINKILIVDDMYARGYTTAAIINKLEENKVILDKIDVFTPLIKGETNTKFVLP